MTADPSRPAGPRIGELRVAIAHEWIDNPGGAENVVREMLRVFPDADLWSLWSRSPARESMPVPVRTSWVARTPLAGHKTAALPLMPLAWHTLSTRAYDVVLSSTYAFAHAARFPSSPGALSLAYVHTPARYWWTPDFDGRGAGRAFWLPRQMLRGADRRIARRHDSIAANSREVQARVARFWHRPADVIHPPVDVDFFTPGDPQTALPFDEYVLGVSRFIPYKRLDLVIATGEAAGLPVVIAGAGPLQAELDARARSASVPVVVERGPSRERVRDLMRGATAFVFPVHEDFGIVPVEAMAAGTPVVGIDAGGLRETVTEGVSGRLVDGADPIALARAVHALPTSSPAQVAGAVAHFASERFRAELAAWVDREAAP